MPDGVRAVHGGKVEALGYVLGPADLLVDLHPPPASDHFDVGHLARKPLREPGQRSVIDADHGMGIVQHDIGATEGATDPFGGLLHGSGRLAAERQLGLAAPSLAIDGEARAVRPAVRQRGEHAGGEPAKLGFE
jgi:hypothetical protein